MTGAENRKHTRYQIQTPIMFSNYLENPHCYYGAEMENYSTGGIFFVSKYELPLGSVIYFKKAIYGLDSISQKIEEISLGRVVWCRDTNNHNEYGYGIAAENIDSALVLQRYLSIIILEKFCLVCHTTQQLRKYTKKEADHVTGYQKQRLHLSCSKI